MYPTTQPMLPDSRKRCFLVFFLAFAAQTGMSQTHFYNQRSVFEDTVLKYNAQEDMACLFISSDFANAQIVDKAKMDSLADCTILRIDLAYTLFKTSKNFDQQKLNSSRWDYLYNHYPLLFGNNATTYFNKCQSGATTAKEAKQYRHGFFVYYRKNVDSVVRANELDVMNDLVKELEQFEKIKETEKAHEKKSEIKPIAKNPDSYREEKPKVKPPKPKYKTNQRSKPKDPKACRTAFYGSRDYTLANYLNENNQYKSLFRKKDQATIRILINQYGAISSYSLQGASSAKFGKYMLGQLVNIGSWNAAYQNRRFQKSTIDITVNYSKNEGFSYTQQTISPKKIIPCGCVDDDSLFVKPPVPVFAGRSMPDNMGDGTVYQVFNRIKPLKNTMLVMDVTSSMVLHIQSTIHILNDSIMSTKTNLKSVVVFNDGDAKRDGMKMAGSTGGVYYTGNIKPTALARFILESMKKGSGGDCPENNIEATLIGIQQCTDCSDIVMIADNYATPRDGNLVERIDRPIHWILCGNGNFVNPDYLNLIRKNKGFGHTRNSDFSGLENMKEGESIEIDGYYYTLKGGEFKAPDSVIGF